MKKRNLQKLKLNKKPISNLTLEQMDEIHGKGFLSIGKNCTQPSKCDIEKWSKGIFCKKPHQIHY